MAKRNGCQLQFYWKAIGLYTAQSDDGHVVEG